MRKKIVSFHNEKYVLSEETAKHFDDCSIIQSISPAGPYTKDYIIQINNRNETFFGVCHIYNETDEMIENRIQDYENEEKIIEHLSEAFNLFSKLERQHPNELNDFADGIHKCQYVIGMRYAREHRPDLFPIK